MFRSRKGKSVACARIVNWITGRENTRDVAAMRMAQITSAIHARTIRGEGTTLRQLHKISNLEQPQALNVVTELERSGVVQIDRNMSDAFESLVSLTEDAKSRLDEAQNEETLKRSA